MKRIKVVVLLVGVLVLASCGQSRFTKKKYLNLKPIEEAKTSQGTDDLFESDKENTVFTEEALPKESAVTIENESRSFAEELNENTLERVSDSDPDELIEPDINRSLIEQEPQEKFNFPILEKTDKDSGDEKMNPIVRDGIILSIIELVLFISLVTFFIIAFSLNISTLAAVIVMAAIIALMIAVGLISIFRGKKGLDAEKKSTVNIIFGISLIVVGGISILSSVISGLNFFWFYLFE